MTWDFLLIHVFKVPAEILIFGVLGMDGIIKLEWNNPGCMPQRVW